jgi:hypothetical protein
VTGGSRVILLGAALLTGCAVPLEAPDDLGSIGGFLFAQFEGDEGPLLEAVRNVRATLATEVAIDGPRRDRQFAVEILGEDQLTDVTHPDVDVQLQSPVALSYRSVHAVAAMARLQTVAEQTPFEPSSPDVYDRSFDSDVACWLDGSCDRLETINAITKDNLLYTVPYVTRKHFRRLALEDGAAIVSRTWSEEVGVGEQGRNSIDQNYAADFWIEDPEDPSRTLRLQYAWSSVTLEGVDLNEVDIRGIIADGVDKTFVAQDEWITEQGW